MRTRKKIEAEWKSDIILCDPVDDSPTSSIWKMEEKIPSIQNRLIFEVTCDTRDCIEQLDRSIRHLAKVIQESSSFA